MAAVGSTQELGRAGSFDTSPSAPDSSRRLRTPEGRGEKKAGEKRTPWLVPVDQPLELLFFHKVFKRLRMNMGTRGGDEPCCNGVPLVAFQRAMSRLFHVLGEEDQCFNARPYDVNGDGSVSWWEFCTLWKEEQPSVHLSLHERIHLTLECPEMSRLGRVVSVLVLTAICISAGGFMLSTLPSLQEQPCSTCEPEPFPVFNVIDTVCVILFTIEYLVRLGTAAYMRTELPIMNQELTLHLMCTDELIRWPTKLQRAWDFVRALPNLIDLAAIVPSYVAWCMPKRAPEDGGDSSMVVLKLIRLMRVVRAFRLGRRFEAVIIIARAMQRSTRAIWVLILNMCMGTVIFGSIMFFVEQGTYDPYTRRFTRPGSWGLNTATNRYEREKEDSPFESIPHAFWWALVTATTAGYGDMSPTTILGKVTAGVCMIWSLCVIALPVGVIGANFESVWEEYDTEKRAESEIRQNERRLEKSVMASIDPLSQCSLLRVEVFDDSRMATLDNDTFLGEAEARMRIDPGSAEPSEAQLELPLQPNLAKSDMGATGKVWLKYTWTPTELPEPEPGVLLHGRLLVTLLRAEGLARVDWKASPSAPSRTEACAYCDPYVVVTLYPSSPSKDGIMRPKAQQSTTVLNSWTPTWNEVLSFDFHWKQEGVLAKRASAKQALVRRMSLVAPADEVGDPGSDGDVDLQVLDALPQVMADLEEVRQAAPALAQEVHELRRASRAVLAALGLPQEHAGSLPEELVGTLPEEPRLLPALGPAGAEAGLGGWCEEEQPTGGPQGSPRVAGPEDEAGFQFVVPGMIAEEPSAGTEEPDPSAVPTGGSA